MDPLKVIAFLITGFLLGLKHSLDTDHLAAVSTIVSRNSEIRKSALQGALWGMGHTTTLLLVGFFILIFKLSSILGMTLFGLLTAIPLALLDKRLKLVNRVLKFVIASASIAIGLSIILQSI